MQGRSAIGTTPGRRRVVADNTVCHERGRESRVVLPIIKRRSRSPTAKSRRRPAGCRSGE